MLETIIISTIALAISYYIIRGAVKDAVQTRIEPYMKVQNAILKWQAKQAGMSQEEIDKAWMSDKQFKKKYSEMKIKS